MTTFHVGDIVKCVSRKTFDDRDRFWLSQDKIKAGDTLKINWVEEPGSQREGQLGFVDKDFVHDPRNVKLVRRGKK